jgi:hypothetical protein
MLVKSSNVSVCFAMFDLFGKNRVTHHLPSQFTFDSDCLKKKYPLVTLVIPQNGDFNGTIIHKWWNFHGARGYLCFYWGLIHRKLKPGDVCHVAKSP